MSRDYRERKWSAKNLQEMSKIVNTTLSMNIGFRRRFLLWYSLVEKMRMVFKNMCIKFHEVWINIVKVSYVETEGNYFRSVLTLTALQLEVECSA